MDKKRITQVFDGKQWQSADFAQMKPGALFRMWESDGSPVVYEGVRQWQMIRRETPEKVIAKPR